LFSFIFPLDFQGGWTNRIQLNPPKALTEEEKTDDSGGSEMNAFD
jgi:hypothetical protein